MHECKQFIFISFAIWWLDLFKSLLWTSSYQFICDTKSQWTKQRQPCWICILVVYAMETRRICINYLYTGESAEKRGEKSGQPLVPRRFVRNTKSPFWCSNDRNGSRTKQQQMLVLLVHIRWVPSVSFRFLDFTWFRADLPELVQLGERSESRLHTFGKYQKRTTQKPAAATQWTGTGICWKAGIK